MNCPTCKATNAEARPKRLQLYPLGVVAIFGLVFAMLHQVSAPQQFHCDGCGLDFAKRTAVARFARIVLFVFGAVIGLAILAAIVVTATAHRR
jgi:hypothetical protein